MFLFKKISADLLPTNVELISPNPTHPLLILLEISFLSGFILTLPLIIVFVVKWLFPALYSYEKKLITNSVITIIPMFLVCCAFAYLIFIPLTLKLLFTFVFSIGVVPFLELGFFFNFILLSIFVFGLIFLAPIIMRTATQLGIIKKDDLKKWFKWVIIGAVVVGAFITPDGTGITQLIFGGTLIILYGIGLLILPRESNEKNLTV